MHWTGCQRHMCSLLYSKQTHLRELAEKLAISKAGNTNTRGCQFHTTKQLLSQKLQVTD